MAEVKRYITQVQKNGSVMISEDVISTIVVNTVAEVEGVVSMGAKTDFAELIEKKSWNKVLKINIGENDEVDIECSVILAYGQSVVTVAKAVQEAVTSALESTTGVKISGVNVNVCGIIRQ